MLFRRQRQPLQLLWPALTTERIILQYKQGLEQRAPAQVPLLQHRLHHLLERRLLVTIRLQRRPANLPQQLPKRTAPLHPAPHHHRIDKKTNQPFHLLPLPTRHRAPHRYIFLTRIPVQQHLVHRQ